MMTPSTPHPRRYHNQHPEKITGRYAEPSNSTSTISAINPESQPRNDTGMEALGRAGFKEDKVRHSYFLRNLRHAIGFWILFAALRHRHCFYRSGNTLFLNTPDASHSNPHDPHSPAHPPLKLPAHPPLPRSDAEKRSPHSRPLAPGMAGCKKDFGYGCSAAPLDASTTGKKIYSKKFRHDA